LTPAVDVVGIGEAMVLLETPPGEPLRGAERLTVRVAGAELTCLAAAARFGLRTALLSRVGADPLGQRVADAVAALGVTPLLDVDPAAPTGLFIKEIRADGARRVHYYRAGSAASRMSGADVADVAALAPRALVVGGITLALGTGPRQAVFAAVRQARACGARVLLDPNLRPSLGDHETVLADLRRLLADCDLLVLGTDEADALLGTRDPDTVRTAAPEVLLKAGADGLWFDNGTTMSHLPSAARHVVDPVGAGDAVAGTYLAGRLLGLPPRESATIATQVAAGVVGVPGDTEGLPTPAAARTLLSRVTRP
jgi:2-dehydro-3-deoxygluconokinase